MSSVAVWEPLDNANDCCGTATFTKAGDDAAMICTNNIFASVVYMLNRAGDKVTVLVPPFFAVRVGKQSRACMRDVIT